MISRPDRRAGRYAATLPTAPYQSIPSFLRCRPAHRVRQPCLEQNRGQMYCKKCYAKLDSTDSNCAQCGAEFSSSHPETYLRRPFPVATRILLHVIATTIVGIMAD